MKQIMLPESFALYHQRVEDSLYAIIPQLDNRSTLREACEYALLNGGKRFRPLITHLVADAIGFGADVTYAALSVEFFHTASLAVDDLPCLDNDDFRRNVPSLHKVYGEAMALLVSYALIAAGYELIAKNARVLSASGLPFAPGSDQICVLALENATLNTGLKGATGGQFLDLNPPDTSFKTLEEVIHKKTVSLFEIAFVFGWLFGGGQTSQLETVKQAAFHFGMAFQIADDIGDVFQDLHQDKQVNVAVVFGVDKAQKLLQEQVVKCKGVLQQLNLATPHFIDLISYLENMND